MCNNYVILFPIIFTHSLPSITICHICLPSHIIMSQLTPLRRQSMGSQSQLAHSCTVTQQLLMLAVKTLIIYTS